MSDRLTDGSAALLQDWVAPDLDQDRLRQHYLGHLRAQGPERRPDGPPGWSRACRGAHLTASALICAPAERRVLLTLHGKLGRWLQTGGHVEASDDNLIAAALREASEESGLPGLSIEPLPLLLSRHEVLCGPISRSVHLDVQFLVVSRGTPPPVVSTESRDVAWFAADALPSTDDSVRDLVAAAGRRLGWC